MTAAFTAQTSHAGVGQVQYHRYLDNAKTTTSLNDYHIITEVGKGCFSTVYHAVHIASQRSTALKVIKKSGSNIQTVMNEIQALLRLRGHPNIVQLYEVFEDREHIYMAMEYCSGGNLHNYLVAYGKLTESHARQWFRQLLSAVMFCQQQGVVSRDIKNSNVVIDDEGNAKLADFGLCVLVNNVNIERIGSSAGSAVFAAPEVYSARKTPYQVIPSEMWALGAVLHSMIKRVLPFPHENYSQHWHAYHVPENVSQSLQHLLKGLLAFNPQDRLSPIGVLSHPWVSGRPTMAPSSAEPAVRAARRHSHTAYTSAFQTNTLAV